MLASVPAYREQICFERALKQGNGREMGEGGCSGNQRVLIHPVAHNGELCVEFVIRKAHRRISSADGMALRRLPAGFHFPIHHSALFPSLS